MGHYGVVVRDGEKQQLRAHNNVPDEIPVALFRKDVVYALPIACPVEGMRDTVLRGTEKRVHQAEILEAKANRNSPSSFRVSRP